MDTGFFMMIRRLNRKRLIKWTIICVGLFLLIVIVSDLIVRFSYRDYIYSSLTKLPEKKVGLLLGTNKYLRKGGINPYYQYRLDAAAELIRTGKIKFLIVSGDNSKIEYNEPVQMRDDLIKMGVDSALIFLDYAGFRTLDSIMRAQKIFGQNDFTVISQPFHNERALFIARQRNIFAIAFNARDVSLYMGIKVQFRELFARVKLMIDLYLINKQPKFLGDRVFVGSPPKPI